MDHLHCIFHMQIKKYNRIDIYRYKNQPATKDSESEK